MSIMFLEIEILYSMGLHWMYTVAVDWVEVS